MSPTKFKQAHTHYRSADLQKYLDNAGNYGELRKLNFAEYLYSLVEQLLYVAKETAIHTAQMEHNSSISSSLCHHN